ncbi:PREDICTED: DNA polymerase epsilon subunit B [Tarenaya hassleriana]|uniref:DNA polymerase epsilon subunit B n=1 Tax=Tarenaya hassleriana TaxID=28532 RepID=UPI00053C1269|nr:PREDICTED: DNA polymerase epsilon subunit B [Tarenaya hassleriana]
MSSPRRKKIQKKFKIRGYNLKIEALNEIRAFVDQFPEDEEEAIDLLLDNLQQESLKSSTVDGESVRRVVNLLLEADNAADEPATTVSESAALRVIDAFFAPKYRYDGVKKQFIEHTSSLPVHGEASAKTALYRDRFMLLLQRVSRAEHFSRPAFDTELSGFESYEISSIQSLIIQKGRRWVMGVISQLEDGHFYLEDLSACVEIDLSKAKITTGFFTENSIVLAEGELQVNGIFQVITCGFPPLEEREKTLKLHAGFDFFGSGMFTKEEMLKLADLERKAVSDTFVVLSDIWVDDEEVLGKLEIVLSGFESVEIVPSLFVFMGNFCSHPCNLSFGSYSKLRQQFGKLGKMIGKHPRLKEHSRFLFIPGPDDAGPSTVLPRCSLPSYLTEELREIIPNAIFSSNPCRVKFYTQEIVFFRQDLLHRMRRSCLIPPSTEETEDPFQHLVYTITHQSHLCPLPLMVQPIIWNYDHALRLYPTPHTMVLGDKSEQKVCKFGGTTCFNPGSFATDSTFVAYRPSTHEVELSAL